MAILEYIVTQPPTGKELEGQARASIGRENKAARGLLALQVRLVEAPVDTPEEPQHEAIEPAPVAFLFRALRTTLSQGGEVTTIEGEATVGVGARDCFYSNSAVIELPADPTQPATVHAVKPETVSL